MNNLCILAELGYPESENLKGKKREAGKRRILIAYEIPDWFYCSV